MFDPDSVGHFAPLTNSQYTAGPYRRRHPDGPLCIETNSVWDSSVELRPQSTAMQAAIVGHIERGQTSCK